MSESGAFRSVLNEIIKEDSRYAIDSYFFVQEAVAYTIDSVNGQGTRHVSGAELLEGIRRYGLEQFGPLAKKVFEHWGISCTKDFGNIVFNMIGYRLLRARQEDKIEDFIDVFDFHDVFVAVFCPEQKKVHVPVIT